MRYCMPPDPNTKKPGFIPPAKFCDTHFNIFGPPDKSPLPAGRKSQAEDFDRNPRRALRVLPIQVGCQSFDSVIPPQKIISVWVRCDPRLTQLHVIGYFPLEIGFHASLLTLIASRSFVGAW